MTDETTAEESAPKRSTKTKTTKKRGTRSTTTRQSSDSGRSDRTIRPGRFLNEVERYADEFDLSPSSTVQDLVDAIGQQIIQEAKGG